MPEKVIKHSKTILISQFMVASIAIPFIPMEKNELELLNSIKELPLQIERFIKQKQSPNENEGLFEYFQPNELAEPIDLQREV